MATEQPSFNSLSLVPHWRPASWFGRLFLSLLRTMTEYTDSFLRAILTSTRVIALVGMSPNPIRPSYYVGRYLGLKGFTVIPVNPGHAGEEILGQKVYGNLSSIPVERKVDMVDIFRRSEAVPPIVDEAIESLPHLKTIWMQIGVMNDAAAKRAETAGLRVVQNRCPKIEYQRLFGELRMGGFATGAISSKL